MTDARPNPDALLAQLETEALGARRGRLKIFLGMCAGVGKTYAMLETARLRAIEGQNVLIGVVETHKRTETEMLVLGLDLMPRREVPYQGVVLREFDLDLCLARKPELVLLDELAHTNAPGSRHEKRWQDVDELLAAGIGVYTTLNIQHIESLNDVVAQITGVVVRETVPDSMVDGADEIELVDLPPEELQKRLQEGRVYLPDQALVAARNFFRLGNLIALRELSLRYVAEHVDEQVQRYRRDRSIGRTWPVSERLLVAVTASPQSARLVRATRRLASRLQAEWLAVHVETPRLREASPKERERLHRILRLAEQMGAETKMLSGVSLADELLAFARTRNVTKLVVGKSARSLWRRLLRGSVIEQLARGLGEIDLYVISGEGEQAKSDQGPAHARIGLETWVHLGWGGAAVGLCTLICGLFFPRLDPANIVMLYLACVALVALRLGRAAGVFASLLSVAAFDFFFVPPRNTFAISDVQYLVMFVVMLVVSLLIGNLTAAVRQQAGQERRRAARSTALYELSQKLADTGELTPLVRAAVSQTELTFTARAEVWLRDAGGTLAPFVRPKLNEDDRERAVAEWVLQNGERAGRGTTTLPAARSLFLPLVASQSKVGVLAIEPADETRFLHPDELQLLETFATQIALAIERAQLVDAASVARVQVETERLRNALLSSVSHDFRTPLAAILGAASGLVGENGTATLADAGTQRDLVLTILQESRRLDRMVRNLLDMTRLESGAVELRKEWHPLEELVGAALHQLREPLEKRKVLARLPPDLPLVNVDGALLEQVFVNLIDNAIKHTPAETPIEIAAAVSDQEVLVGVADRGPGIAPEQLGRIFQKFYRAPAAQGRGAGLGLSICDAIVKAHGGRIWAENRDDGGTIFRFTLPLASLQPVVPPEPAASETP